MSVSIEWRFREGRLAAFYHIVSRLGPESQPFPLLCFLCMPVLFSRELAPHALDPVWLKPPYPKGKFKVRKRFCKVTGPKVTG